MSADSGENFFMLPTNGILNPYVLLTRLPENDIKHLMSNNQNEQVLSNSHIQPVQIKQEPIDDGYSCQENVYNGVVQTEDHLSDQVSLTARIKTEELDSNDSVIFNTPSTSYTDNISDMIQYKCDQCPAEFENNELYIVHRYYSHYAEPYACNICDKKFSLSIHLLTHLNNHKKEEISDIFLKKFKESILPTNIQSSSTSYLAPDNNDNNSTVILQDSNNSGTKNVQNKEPRKKKNMPMVSNYSNESSVKRNEKFKCRLCEKNFLNQAALNAHFKFHTNRRSKIGAKMPKRKPNRLQRIKCNWCDSVITQCNLIRHINTFHPLKKPVKCTHCSKKFKNHFFMKLHKKDCHKN